MLRPRKSKLSWRRRRFEASIMLKINTKRIMRTIESVKKAILTVRLKNGDSGDDPPMSICFIVFTSI
jgi:hypothetical protein